MMETFIALAISYCIVAVIVFFYWAAEARANYWSDQERLTYHKHAMAAPIWPVLAILGTARAWKNYMETIDKLKKRQS